MYRENPETHLEFSTWEDMKVLLYGAEESICTTKQPLRDGKTSNLHAKALDIHAVEAASQGQWCFFC